MYRQSLSRREFLKSMGASTAGVALAASGLPALATGASAAPRAQAAEVVLTTSGWPLVPLWTEEEVANAPDLQGYNNALQAWLDENPNVRFERIEANIWSQDAIIPLIAGGTAPTFVFAETIGGFSTAGTRAAFVQGLVADVTPAIEEYGLREKLTPGALAAWEPLTNVNGRYYNYPIDSGHQGFFYRRDLLAEAGIEDPPIDWTWDDLFNMARALTSAADGRTGFGAPAWTIGDMLASEGFDLLSRVPTPDTPWNWSRDLTSNPEWFDIARKFRSLVYEDGAALVDTAMGGNEDYAQLFINGTIAITAQNVLAGFGGGSVREGIASVARQLDRPYEEVIGFRGKPKGANGYVRNTTYVGGVAFNPDVTSAELSAGVGVVDYMFLGPGWDIQKAGQYESTGDLQAVFNYPLPIDGKYEYAGVPGTFEDAYGQRTRDELTEIIAVPIPPAEALYFPAEENVGPSSTAIDDGWSTLTYDSGDVDAETVMREAENIWNQQAAGFSSSTPDDVFKASAQAYFADVDAFWAETAPDFHENVFRAWYENTVLPAISD
jgi:ABC-type glycerol-3-phosphate transport system substrate-binding protein